MDVKGRGADRSRVKVDPPNAPIQGKKGSADPIVGEANQL